MNKKRIISLILAILTVLSTMAIFSSCNKNKEPVKEKRTNVYAADEVNIPNISGYINRIASDGNNIYLVYYKDFTITYNEFGEEVERREGYFYEEGYGGVDDDFGVMPMSVETYSTESEPENTETKNEDETSDDEKNKLPEGWYYSYESVQCIYTYPIAGGEGVEVMLPEDFGYLNRLTINKNGNLICTKSNYNWDEETSAYTVEYLLLELNPKTGEIEKTVELNSEILKAGIDPNSSYISNLFAAGDGKIYVSMDTTIMLLDSDYSFSSKINYEGGYINNLIDLGDKVLVCGSSDSGTQQFKIIENGQISDYKSEGLSELSKRYFNVIGAAQNKLYYSESYGICAYDFETDTYGEVMNFLNSDIDSTQGVNPYILPDGRILISLTDYNAGNSNTSISIMSKVPDEELQEEIIIRLGCMYNDYNLTKSVIAYNKKNNGTRISLVSYDRYNYERYNDENGYDSAVTQMNNDIITGNLPDIIMLDSALPVESYFQQGIFANLNEFIDSEENGLDRSKYLSNIFDATTVDGKMYSMIMTFSLNSLVAKSKFVGEEAGWSFEEMMKCINNMPDDMRAFFEQSRENIIDNFFSYGTSSFINWETGETIFGTPIFIDFMEFLAKCPEKGYWDEYYDNMGEVYDEDLEREMQMNYELRYFKDKGLFQSQYISNFSAALNAMNTFSTSEITFVGYPTSDGKGNGTVISPILELAISSKSKSKAQAWDVLKFILEDQIDSEVTYMFSVSREKLEIMKDSVKENYGQYNHELSEEDIQWYKDAGYSDEYIEFMQLKQQPYSDEAVQLVMDLLTGATEVCRTDKELLNIINSELSAFFAGAKSASETADIIRSRAELYISENS